MNMDIKQEEVTTLHEINIERENLLNKVEEISQERRVSIIMPMLYSELRNDAIKRIKRG